MTDTTYTVCSGNSSNADGYNGRTDSASDKIKEITGKARLLERSWWALEDDLTSELAKNLWQSWQAQIDNAHMYFYDLDAGEAATLQALLYTYMDYKFDL